MLKNENNPFNPNNFGPHLDEPSKDLHWGAENGDLQTIESSLQEGADINALDTLDECGLTALKKAMNKGHIDVVDYLLKHEADINMPTYGTNPYNPNSALFYGVALDEASKKLHWASKNGDLETVKYSLKDGAEIDSLDTISFFSSANSTTPLHKAAQNGYLKITKYLLENGADINAATGDNESTPLIIASQLSEKAYISIVKCLLAHDANLNIKNKNNITALHAAILGGNFETQQLSVNRSLP